MNYSESEKEKYITRIHREIIFGHSQFHPNLIKVIGVADDPHAENSQWKLPLCVMEYGGESLQEYIFNSPRRIGFEEKKKILLGIANGIKHLHKQNLVHRDMKVFLFIVFHSIVG